MNINTHNKRKNTLNITPISSNEFLLEGIFNSARFGYVTEPIINYIQLNQSLHLETGKDFLGQGKIEKIILLNQNNDNGYFIFKIIIINYNEQTK